MTKSTEQGRLGGQGGSMGVTTLCQSSGPHKVPTDLFVSLMGCELVLVALKAVLRNSSAAAMLFSCDLCQFQVNGRFGD